MKVLMVCLGNICRSPLAEGILRDKAARKGIVMQVDSAGTGGWHVGEPPDKRSQLIAKLSGIDISSQRARQVRISDFEEFDCILAMDTANFKDLVALAPNLELAKKVKLILDYSFPGQNANVPDPYYGSSEGFSQTFSLLENAIESFIAQLK